METLMTDVNIFKFPTLDDGLYEIEKTFCEIYKKYRDGECLEPEVIDWFDTANTWLQIAESKR